jgi:short subunit dehydrogenase-like uncharacterized protein
MAELDIAGLGGLAYEKESVLSPLEQLYFTGEMLSKHAPCMSAMQELVDAEGEASEETWNKFESTFNEFLDFSWASQWDGIRYDLVFYGVSGYTGYLMMEYLKRAALVRNPEKFTFAFAGRTVSKIQEQRDKEFAGTEWEDTPIIQASYDDVVSIIDLAKSAYAIVNVAGPYLLAQGEILVDACCHMGTDYCDVSGEIPWTLRALELHEHAKQGNAIIAPSAAVAGSYPDVLTFMCAKKLRDEQGEELRKAVIYATGGGASAGSSGGTLATRAAMSAADSDVRKKMADAYSLGGFIPQFDRNGMKECKIKQGTGEVEHTGRKDDMDSILSKVSQDPETGLWRAPWVYAYFDTRIVRRSNALMATLENKPYGRNLVWQEFMRLPAEALMQASAIREAGGEVDREKAALEAQGKYYKQGEGPPLEELGDAYIGFFCYAASVNGKYAYASFNGCDGYFETARAAVEFAITCRFDKDKMTTKGGCLNAAVAGQSLYLARLIGSGLKCKVAEERDGDNGGWIPEWELGPLGM